MEGLNKRAMCGRFEQESYVEGFNTRVIRKKDRNGGYGRLNSRYIRAVQG